MHRARFSSSIISCWALTASSPDFSVNLVLLSDAEKAVFSFIALHVIRIIGHHPPVLVRYHDSYHRYTMCFAVQHHCPSCHKTDSCVYSRQCPVIDEAFDGSRGLSALQPQNNARLTGFDVDWASGRRKPVKKHVKSVGFVTRFHKSRRK